MLSSAEDGANLRRAKVVIAFTAHVSAAYASIALSRSNSVSAANFTQHLTARYPPDSVGASAISLYPPGFAVTPAPTPFSPTGAPTTSLVAEDGFRVAIFSTILFSACALCTYLALAGDDEGDKTAEQQELKEEVQMAEFNAFDEGTSPQRVSTRDSVAALGLRLSKPVVSQ